MEELFVQIYSFHSFHSETIFSQQNYNLYFKLNGVMFLAIFKKVILKVLFLFLGPITFFHLLDIVKKAEST